MRRIESSVSMISCVFTDCLRLTISQMSMSNPRFSGNDSKKSGEIELNDSNKKPDVTESENDGKNSETVSSKISLVRFNNIYCPERVHRRASVLCPRCRIYQNGGCRDFYINESMLRSERYKIELSLCGSQRRLIAMRSMKIDSESGEVTGNVIDYDE